MEKRKYNFKDKDFYDRLRETMFIVEEVAELFRVTKWAILKRVKDGDLPGHKRGKRWYFFKEDIYNYIKGIDVA